MNETGSDVQAMTNDVIGIWMTGCICLLGVAGNVVSFVVLKRAFGEQSPMFHVLRAMSVSDSVFLLAVFTVQSAVNASQYFGLQHVVENFRGYVQYGVWPLLMTTQVSRRKCVLSVKARYTSEMLKRRSNNSNNKHNCVLSNAGLSNALTQTGFCTSLKSGFYFRFHSPSNTKSALPNFICTWDLVLIG